jgi:hypothetical protein
MEINFFDIATLLIKKYKTSLSFPIYIEREAI